MRWCGRFVQDRDARERGNHFFQQLQPLDVGFSHASIPFKALQLPALRRAFPGTLTPACLLAGALVLSDLRWNKNTPTALKGNWLKRAFGVDSLALEGNGPPKTAKIVVAEDDVLMRLMLADVLRYEGFQVFEAAKANEAISILKCTPDVDVVISDMRMRGIQDGLTLARYARAHYPSVLLVLASSSLPPLDTTFDACFVKPFSPKEIVTWIKRRLGAARTQSL